MLTAWYRLTAYVPRRLPTSHQELDNFRTIAQEYYGLECTSDQWITVCGQITSTPASSLRKSYGSIINAAKRLNINRVAHEQKLVAADRLKAKLEELVEKEAKDARSTAELKPVP